jgi:hypothetical protein
MAAWTKDELARVGRAAEIEIAARRPGGRVFKRVTIWVVRIEDDLYVRSAVKGADASWFRAVQETSSGRLWAGGIEKNVSFLRDNTLDDQVDSAYRAKYSRYAGPILNSCLTPAARSTTMRLAPLPK